MTGSLTTSLAEMTTANFLDAITSLANFSDPVLMLNVSDTMGLNTSDWLGNITTTSTTPKPAPKETPKPTSLYDTAEFEILLPCIFGIFVVLSLSLIMFYSKSPIDYEIFANQKEMVEEKDNAMPESNGVITHGESNFSYDSGFDHRWTFTGQ